MVHVLAIWLLVAAFVGAGLINAVGPRATRESFVRWGYPGWWRWLTAALEIASAILIALPPARPAGLALGAAIVVAAAATVLRHRELSHLAPLGGFLALTALAAFTS